MDTRRLIIRFDADDRIGTGHFVRCVALAQHARVQEFEVTLAVKHLHGGTERILRANGEAYIKIPTNTSWTGEPPHLSNGGTDAVSAIILDISTIYAFQDIAGISSYVKSLQRHCPLILLDGMWDNALAERVDAQFDMVLAPYVGITKASAFEERNTIYLTGPEYFVFGMEYEMKVRRRRNIRDIANRLLVSFGGSDPQSISLKVLDAISSIPGRRLHIRIIVGPNFNSVLKKRILERARIMACECEIVNSPRSLVEHMLWSDMAIGSSGLTKYELALTGTPSIQISVDEEHARINKPFADTNVTEHLGIQDELTVEQIKHAIIALLDDSRRRQLMSHLGQQLVDTGGASRIMKEVDRLLHVERVRSNI